MDLLQDAHEFLNYLLNECSEVLEKEAAEEKRAKSASAAALSNGFHHSQEEARPASGNPPGQIPQTWIHELFQV